MKPSNDCREMMDCLKNEYQEMLQNKLAKNLPSRYQNLKRTKLQVCFCPSNFQRGVSLDVPPSIKEIWPEILNSPITNGTQLSNVFGGREVN